MLESLQDLIWLTFELLPLGVCKEPKVVVMVTMAADDRWFCNGGAVVKGKFVISKKMVYVLECSHNFSKLYASTL